MISFEQKNEINNLINNVSLGKGKLAFESLKRIVDMKIKSYKDKINSKIDSKSLTK